MPPLKCIFDHGYNTPLLFAPDFWNYFSQALIGPEHIFCASTQATSEHQSQPKPSPPGNLACYLASTFPNHPRPSNFPSTFPNLPPTSFPSNNPSPAQPATSRATLHALFPTTLAHQNFQAPPPPSKHQSQPSPPCNLACNLATQPPPPIKTAKHFFQAADAFGFPSTVLHHMSENFFFWPMQLSGPRLESHLAIYNQHSKMFSGIVKVQKYFMPKRFATCNTMS